MCQMCDEQDRNDTSEAHSHACDFCAGRGFQLDWIDPGGVMRAVPGDTCPYCDGSGSLPPQDSDSKGSAQS